VHEYNITQGLCWCYLIGEIVPLFNHTWVKAEFVSIDGWIYFRWLPMRYSNTTVRSLSKGKIDILPVNCTRLFENWSFSAVNSLLGHVCIVCVDLSLLLFLPLSKRKLFIYGRLNRDIRMFGTASDSPSRVAQWLSLGFIIHLLLLLLMNK